MTNKHDTTHCIHGNYIGYPGGPDYMCQNCEDGNNIKLEGIRYRFYMQTKGNEPIRFNEPVYQITDKQKELIALSNDDLKIWYVEEKYIYWSNNRDIEKYNITDKILGKF